MKWIVGYLAVRCIAWLGLFRELTVSSPPLAERDVSIRIADAPQNVDGARERVDEKLIPLARVPVACRRVIADAVGNTNAPRGDSKRRRNKP